MSDLKAGSVVDLEVYGELCCDLCNEIIHNHISCPVCKTSYAATDQYCDLYDETELTCEVCQTKYKLVTGSCWYGDCKAEIVFIKS